MDSGATISVDGGGESRPRGRPGGATRGALGPSTSSNRNRARSGSGSGSGSGRNEIIEGPVVVEGGPLARVLQAADGESVATTQLASEVGSVLGIPKEAFLKSITFLAETPRERSIDEADDDSLSDTTQIPWGFTLVDVKVQKKQRVVVQATDGVVSLSRVCEGDYIKEINGRRLGPSMNAERALARMNECFETEGYLSVSTACKEGDDILIHATIIKPRPNMTYEELGMVVWHWGYLCIKSIDKESIFRKTVLKSTDHIISVNDIVCDEMSPESFAHVVTRLEKDITITVLRRKQRFTGMFR